MDESHRDSQTGICGRRATICAWLFGHKRRREIGHESQTATTPLRPEE